MKPFISAQRTSDPQDIGKYCPSSGADPSTIEIIYGADLEWSACAAPRDGSIFKSLSISKVLSLVGGARLNFT
jgi:hypothetical protein